MNENKGFVLNIELATFFISVVGCIAALVVIPEVRWLIGLPAEETNLNLSRFIAIVWLIGCLVGTRYLNTAKKPSLIYLDKQQNVYSRRVRWLLSPIIITLAFLPLLRIFTPPDIPALPMILIKFNNVSNQDLEIYSVAEFWIYNSKPLMDDRPIDTGYMRLRILENNTNTDTIIINANSEVSVIAEIENRHLYLPYYDAGYFGVHFFFEAINGENISDFGIPFNSDLESHYVGIEVPQ